MKLVVAIQAYQRPDLLWRTLHSLWKAANCTPDLLLQVIAFQDMAADPPHGVQPLDPDVYNLLHPAIGHPLCLPVHCFVPAVQHHGANEAAFVLASKAFELGENVVFVEDDLEVSLDFFRWMIDAFGRFEADQRVKVISSVSSMANGMTFQDAFDRRYFTYTWAYAGFHAAGWYRRTWDLLKEHWPPAHKPLDSMSALFNSREHRTLGPIVSRAKHVGYYQGTFNRGLKGEEEFAVYEKNDHIRWTGDMFLQWPKSGYHWSWPKLEEVTCQKSN